MDKEKLEKSCERLRNASNDLLIAYKKLKNENVKLKEQLEINKDDTVVERCPNGTYRLFKETRK